MATLSKGKTFTNGETVTPQKLHELVDLGTVSGIVNADIAAGAAIADSKLAQITTAGKVLPAAVQGTAVVTADPRLSDARMPVPHGHAISDTTGLEAALNGKQAAGSYAAASHTHDDRYYTETEMNTLLAGKQASGSYAPATGIAPSAITGTAVITTDSRLSDARIPSDGSVTDAKISSTAAIADSKLATISTAGKVSNSATTATNANTANAIVARDTNGNFSAGTITAALNGSAATLTTGRTISLTGDVTGTTAAFNGSADAIAATTIATSAVTTAKIAANAITTAKIAAGSAGQVLLSNGAASPVWGSVMEPKAFALVQFTSNSGAFTVIRSQRVTITRTGTGIFNFDFSPALPQVPLICSTGGREDHIWLNLTTTSAVLNTRVFSASGGTSVYPIDDPINNYGDHFVSFLFF